MCMCVCVCEFKLQFCLLAYFIKDGRQGFVVEVFYYRDQ